MVESVDAVETVPLFPGPRRMTDPLDAPQLHRRLAPIQRVRIWDGTTPWAISSNSLYRNVLNDPRVSNDIRRDGYPAMTAVFKQLRVGGGFESFDRRDGQEHESVRRVLMGHFSLKRIEPLRPSIQAALDDLLDQILAGPKPVELMSTLTYPFTSQVICRLMGIPHEDYDEFAHNIAEMVNTESPDRAIAGHAAMREYFGNMVSRLSEEEDPGQGLMARLVAEQLLPGKMPREQVVGMGVSMLLAGYETSANSMGLGIVAFLLYPDQFADLCANHEDKALVANAVEEILRLISLTHKGRRRVAKEDIEVGDITIKAGEGIIFLDDMANRDRSAIPGDVDRLDIRRDTTNHVAFSVGPHHCLGNRLARAELQVFFSTIARRIPALKLSGGWQDVTFRPEDQIYGVDHMMVAWDD